MGKGVVGLRRQDEVRRWLEGGRLMGAEDGDTRGFWGHPQDENGW